MVDELKVGRLYWHHNKVYLYVGDNALLKPDGSVEQLWGSAIAVFCATCSEANNSDVGQGATNRRHLL